MQGLHRKLIEFLLLERLLENSRGYVRVTPPFFSPASPKTLSVQIKDADFSCFSTKERIQWSRQDVKDMNDGFDSYIYFGVALLNAASERKNELGCL